MKYKVSIKLHYTLNNFIEDDSNCMIVYDFCFKWNYDSFVKDEITWREYDMRREKYIREKK